MQTKAQKVGILNKQQLSNLPGMQMVLITKVLCVFTSYCIHCTFALVTQTQSGVTHPWQVKGLGAVSGIRGLNGLPIFLKILWLVDIKTESLLA